MPGFAADRDYIVRLPDPWPEFGAAYLPNPEVWRTGLRLPGIALAQHGLALPLVHPGTAWLITTMPRDVRVRRHADLHFACNFGTTPVTLSDEVISPAGSIIIGTRTLGPADVAVWRQPSD